jgi:hypothetical protein
VLEVSNPSEPPGELYGSYIEAPQPGAKGDEYVLHLKGWVLGRTSTVRAVGVRYRPQPSHAAGDRLLRTTAIRGRRPDIEAAFPQRGGVDAHFEALVGVIGLSPEFELHLAAVLQDGTRVPIGSVRVRHKPLRTGFQPRFQPLAVTCLGRTGTTLLMSVLAAHPEIVLERRFPYEQSPAKYWIHLLKVLSEPANFIQSSHPDTFHDDLWSVGHNPFYDDAVAATHDQHRQLGKEQIERLADFCQRSIDDWYSVVARMQDQPDARYFAEKHMWPNHIATLTAELYPRGKEVFLVRDFRDMACSILAFDQKRGFAGFGRLESKTEEEYLSEVLRPAALRLYDGWRERRDRAHLVRYEDLVLEPRATVRSLLAYLDLDDSDASVESLLAGVREETPALDYHRTSADARSSIGRWRREQGDTFGAVCNELFGEVLAEFGYLQPSEHEPSEPQAAGA